MSEHWDCSVGRSDAPKEFLVSVELYISNAQGAIVLRKPASGRRRAERHDPSAGQADNSRKLKEKSSWLALSKGSMGSGHWRSATCKLSEEGERCLLNIYVNESILYQTIYIHLLNQTDIRQADASLFFKQECISIHCLGGQRWTSNKTTDPVYLQFSGTELCNTWLALLRSYAIPEIYGRWFFPSDGGSYRMWRQVRLTVVQGRCLGNPKIIDNGINEDPPPEPDVMDLGIYCDIHLNDILCGCTTVKKGIGSPDWHESFILSDLPPFESLVVRIWKDKKLLKSTTMGSVTIPLVNFRRGESIEGWFPVLHGGPGACDIQVGELRLKLRVDEEIILPYSAYSGLLKSFNSRNFLDWINDFESRLKLKTLSLHLMSLAVAGNVLIEQVQEIASREVAGTQSSRQTLFRGNTTLTKVMESCMTWYGKAFLEASIGSVLRRLCADKVAIEVDPLRSGKGSKDLDRNVELLIHWCREFWNQIYSVRTECPQEMRRLFETIRTLVEERYRSEDISQESNRELPWQSVSAFCFLRFIVPAILHPHLFGLCPGLPIAPVQRSLTLIAKVIQSLANLNSVWLSALLPNLLPHLLHQNVHKEEFMRGVKDFLSESIPAMIDYILVVSTPTKEYSHHETSLSRHDRLRVVNYLRQRSLVMPMLDRETIPLLPHLLDIPRHLAIIISAVIRSSRNFQARASLDGPVDQHFNEFCSNCFDIEEQALLRVSQLAAKINLDQQTSSPGKQHLLALPNDNTTQPPILTAIPNEHRRPRQLNRPSTAPSPSDSNTPHRRFFSEESSPPTPRVFTLSRANDIPYPGSPRQHVHVKSTSTDSVPSFGIQSSSILTREDLLDGDPAGKRVRGLFKGILRR